MLSEAEVWRINILEGWVPDHDEDLVQMVATSQTLSRCVRSQAESLADVERIQDYLPTKGQAQKRQQQTSLMQRSGTSGVASGSSHL